MLIIRRAAAAGMRSAKLPSITGIAMKLTMVGLTSSRPPRNSSPIFLTRSSVSWRSRTMADKIKVGVASHDQLRERALQIARGERRRRPDEPKRSEEHTSELQSRQYIVC